MKLIEKLKNKYTHFGADLAYIMDKKVMQMQTEGTWKGDEKCIINRTHINNIYHTLIRSGKIRKIYEKPFLESFNELFESNYTIEDLLSE